MKIKSISFGQYHIDNTDPDFLEKYWDYEKNIISPFEISYGSNKSVWIKCQDKIYHKSYEIKCKSFSNNSRCTYCSKKKVHYFDSLGFLYHDISRMIAEHPSNNIEYEITYSIPPNRHEKYYTKCIKCGNLSKNNTSIYNLIKRKSMHCNYCNDGVSIPEKFIKNILMSIGVDFQTQYSPNWANRKIYDFYIKDLNMIIETHGIQHYIENNLGLSLNEEMFNDRYKKETATQNGVYNYIVIDSRYSDLDWLKRNTIDSIGEFFDMSDIDWNLIWSKCQNSIAVDVWNMWNYTNNIGYISEKLNISRCTVRDYLKKGRYLNIIDYDVKKVRRNVGLRQTGGNNPFAKKIICITTKRLFRSVKEASEFYNISKTSISNNLNGRSYSSGKLSNGEKLTWKYIILKHNKSYRIEDISKFISKIKE